MKDLMEGAGKLDEALKLHKTSKQAKKATVEASTGGAPTKRRKRRDAVEGPLVGQRLRNQVK